MNPLEHLRSGCGRLYLLILSIILLSSIRSQLCKENAPPLELPTAYQSRNPDVIKALEFLDKMMNPKVCTGSAYVLVDDQPPGAGFTAQFQNYAKEWLRGATASNFSVPVFIEQGFRYYTQSEECKEYNYKLECLFLPLSECEQEILKTGTRLRPSFPIQLNGNPDAIPPQFRHLGFPLWWGIIQARMFRLQPKVYDHVRTKAATMHNCSGFPFNDVVAGIHVRHGDKKSDGFREHSFEQQLSAIRHSPDCNVRVDDNCYTVNLTQAVDSSGRLVLKDNRRMKVFVASDDASVLSTAVAGGHYIVPIDSGLSQKTGKVGMLTTLSWNTAIGYNASLEVISDVFFLSKCSTLIGSASSQVFRMSVALSNASGILKYAAAVDHDQIHHIHALSRKYDTIFAENFEVPKYD